MWKVYFQFVTHGVVGLSITVLSVLRQEDHKFDATLGYIVNLGMHVLFFLKKKIHFIDKNVEFWKKLAMIRQHGW